MKRAKKRRREESDCGIGSKLDGAGLEQSPVEDKSVMSGQDKRQAGRTDAGDSLKRLPASANAGETPAGKEGWPGPAVRPR